MKTRTITIIPPLMPHQSRYGFMLSAERCSPHERVVAITAEGHGLVLEPRDPAEEFNWMGEARAKGIV